MNQTNISSNNTSDARELIYHFAERVYRYNLARRGNDQEAEFLTRETFQSLPRITNSSPSNPAAAVIVFRAALAQQSIHRHGKDAARLAETDPDHAQELLFQRAQIAALADYWVTIPSIQADILAMACFGGLSGSELSQVTLRDPGMIHRVLAQQSAMVNHLTGLASRTNPPAGFTNRLADEFKNLPRNKPFRRLQFFSQLPILASWAFYKLTSFTQRTPVRIAAGGLVVLIAISALVFTVSFPTPSVRTVQTPTPEAAVDNASATSPDPGILTPPDQATCQRWQSSLTELLGAQAPLSLINNLPINDPNTSGPGGSGIGCYIDLNPDGQAFRVNMQRLASFFSTQGFQRETVAKNGCPTPPPSSSLYSAERACAYTQGNSWVNLKTSPQEKIVLEFSNFRGLYTPDNSFRRGGAISPTVIPTPIGEPYPLSRTPDPKQPYYPYPPFPCPNNAYSEAPCQSSPLAGPLPNPRRQVVLRLGVAINATEPIIIGFINQWAAGNPNTVGFLTPELRKSLPNLSALDRLAGITRRPDLSMKVTWHTVENLGNQLNLTAFIDQTSTLALPGRHQGPIQLVISQFQGQWWVSSLTRSTD